MRPIFSLVMYGRCTAQKLTSAIEPSWIAHSGDISTVSSKLMGESKDGYINLSHELQVNLATRTIYERTAIKIISEAGIQNGSQVSAGYDPAYQRLLFHKIRIIRNGQSINKLELSKIKTIQQETELDRSIYNGTVTAVLFLEDVRKGDIIEYSWSVQGFNPIFRDKYSENLQVQFGSPVGEILYRIICPSGRELNIRPGGTKIVPVVTQQGSDRIYQWTLNDVPALRTQDKLPTWYNPFPIIQVSEYAGWNEVSKWALSLFASAPDLSAGLKKKIEEIKAASGGNEEQEVRAALRFVQDEVRYMGIEMGVSSYKPNAPDKIFAQRFGDCKDKSFLLCTMLRAMHIDASPVLINTVDKQELKNVLPSAVVFDHCTVRVRLGDKTWWFDPTISFQRGRIEDIAYPDYKCGLVLTDTTTGITDIPLQDPGQVVAKEKFTLSDDHGPVRLEITTTYTGSFADDIREEVNNNSLSDMQQGYLNFYNGYYGGTKVADSLRVEDDEASGRMVTHEYYTITRLWEQEKGQNKASFEALLITSILKKPKESDRTMPIAITYPARYTEDIEIETPGGWDFDDKGAQVLSPAFTFNSSIHATDKKVDIIYTYEALKDHVTADEAAGFITDYQKLQDGLGYELTQGASVSSTPAHSRGNGIDLNNNLAKSLLCLALIAGIAYFVRRR